MQETSDANIPSSSLQEPPSKNIGDLNTSPPIINNRFRNRRSKSIQNLTEVDFATCSSLCEKFYVMNLLQSVKREHALMAIDCILNGIVEPQEQQQEISSSQHTTMNTCCKLPNQEDWNTLKAWGLTEVIAFAHEYYHGEYVELFLRKNSTLEDASLAGCEEPQLKKIKRNPPHHASSHVNMDARRYESFHHALEIMREIIEKDQTSFDDITNAIQCIYRQHLISSISFYESSYRKNPLLEKFYYHILELYRQTDQKIGCIKFAEFGLLYNGRQVKNLEHMLNNIQKEQMPISYTFLEKHLNHAKAHQKCLEGVLLFFCDCTDNEAMTKIFEESYRMDPSFIYAYCNIGYLKGFNVFGNRELTLEGVTCFHKAISLCRPCDEFFIRINSTKTLGVLQMISGNFQEAFVQFSKCLEIFPEYYQIYKDRAEAFSMYDTLLAMKDIEKCFEIDPERKSDLCTLLNMKAVLLHKMGRPQEDITAVLEEAMNIDPTNSYPFLTLSGLAIQQEDLDRYLELRSRFKAYNNQSVSDLLNQDIKAFEIFDQIYFTNLENEYKEKKKQHAATWYRIS